MHAPMLTPLHHLHTHTMPSSLSQTSSSSLRNPSSQDLTSSPTTESHLPPIVTFLPIHAHVQATARSSSHLSTWKVSCRPSELIRVGSHIAIIDHRHPQYLCGLVKGVSAIEKSWVEFLITSYTGHDILLCAPLLWTSIPFPFSLIRLLCRSWLIDSSVPLSPSQLTPGNTPWEHCAHLQLITGQRSAPCLETDLRQWSMRS